MWNDKELEEYLKKNLKPSRFDHSLGVMRSSEELASRFNANTNKAKIAGLIHDCGKNLSDAAILSLLKEHKHKITEVVYANPQLMHGLAGAIIAKDIFKVKDKEILDAVTYHTIGRKSMTKMDKIIYIADYIEPSRNFPGVEELRRVASINLDEALLLAFDKTINYVIEKGEIIHSNTIDARNELILINDFRGR